VPGAPNKPPESPPAPPDAPPTVESAEQRALRRLAPSRVALRLPIWRGAPSEELLAPFREAEAKFASGDAGAAESALDRLAVRFAEPRWPSLPEPFRSLRVPIPAPQPPHWDPDHALAPAEREARRFARYAAAQLGLARAAVAAEGALAGAGEELRRALADAEARHAAAGPSAEFWESIDRLWRGVRERVPLPVGRTTAPPAAPPAEGDGA
jgi:hypothetical protein